MTRESKLATDVGHQTSRLALRERCRWLLLTIAEDRGKRVRLLLLLLLRWRLLLTVLRSLLLLLLLREGVHRKRVHARTLRRLGLSDDRSRRRSEGIAGAGLLCRERCWRRSGVDAILLGGEGGADAIWSEGRRWRGDSIGREGRGGGRGLRGEGCTSLLRLDVAKGRRRLLLLLRLSERRCCPVAEHSGSCWL